MRLAWSILEDPDLVASRHVDAQLRQGAFRIGQQIASEFRIRPSLPHDLGPLAS